MTKTTPLIAIIWVAMGFSVVSLIVGIISGSMFSLVVGIVCILVNAVNLWFNYTYLN